MDYLKIYDQLIDRRCVDPIDKWHCDCEAHHRIPRSFGGKDWGDNIVNLTPREHYIAHCLLWKIFKSTPGKELPMRLAVRQLFYSRGHGRNSIERRRRFFRCNHWLYTRIQHGISYYGKKYKADTYGN